jgi:hypothetical protein
MSTVTIDDLIAIHLRYGAGAAALRTRALAQIATKILFLNDGNVFLPMTRIAHDVSTVVGVKAVGNEALAEALEFLGARGEAEKQGSSWRIKQESKTRMDSDLARANDRTLAILANHFPGRVDAAKLRAWFRSCCSSYFARFGNRLVANICRCDPPGPATSGALEAIVYKTARQLGLESFYRELLVGFRAFLTSFDPRDQEHIWSMCQAMFAARLVAAEVGADPILTSDIRDSLVLVDTNVLLTGALEAHKLAPSFDALFKALSSIGVRVAFLHSTKDEYQRATDYYRQNTLRVLDRFPKAVINKAADIFIRTALGRGCSSKEDFERFFDEVSNPIRALGGEFSISELDDAQTDQTAQQGARDQSLKKEISEIWMSQRRRPKSDRVVEHDAALTAVVESLSQGKEKCWVLTLDRTMQELALRRAGKHHLPLWISMDAVIQILAVDAAGPEVPAESFPPLLASIVEYEVEPMMGAYTVEDLSWLLDIEERCAELAEDKIESIATTVARARLTGKTKTDPELQLEVLRAFQREKVAREHDLASIRRDVDELKRSNAEEQALRKAAETAYVSLRTQQIRRGALLRFIAAVLLHFLAVIAAAWLGFELTSRIPQLSGGVRLMVLVVLLLLPGRGAFYRLKDIHWSTYRHTLENAAQTARGELRVHGS